MKDENKELVDALLELDPSLDRQSVRLLGLADGPDKLRELLRALRLIDVLKTSKTCSVDRKVLSTLVSFAEIRRDQWAGVAEMEDPFDIIDELFEASCEEAGSMRDQADSAIKSAYRAIKEAKQ